MTPEVVSGNEGSEHQSSNNDEQDRLSSVEGKQVGLFVPERGPAPGHGRLTNLISRETFDWMLLHGNDRACLTRGFYTYDAFIAATSSFPAFATTGDQATRKREIATFLAQTAHETTGRRGWAALDGPYAWGYCYNKELNSAFWFWMTAQSPKPSCHSVIIGARSPSSSDQAAGRVPGYGVTTNISNGGVECGKGRNPEVEDRIGFYKRYCDMLGISYGCIERREGSEEKVTGEVHNKLLGGEPENERKQSP
ncbi:hypothetical protein GOBAR_DD12606 [Gossypium barbadense]|nr:hypothetical protein GOBAR_DD12606 [Gossypium barbadense]